MNFHHDPQIRFEKTQIPEKNYAIQNQSILDSYNIARIALLLLPDHHCSKMNSLLKRMKYV